MAQQEGSGAGTVMLAFLIGAAAGAAIALLFAPASGKDTREYIGEKAREGKEKAAEAARQARETVKSQRDGLGAAIERGRQAYREVRGEEPV
jgi:gas vesicle protein